MGLCQLKITGEFIPGINYPVKATIINIKQQIVIFGGTQV